MIRYLSLLFVLVITSVNTTKAQTSLGYKLNIGEQYIVKQVADQEIIQEMNGTTHEMTNNIEGDYIFTVVGSNDSLYDLTFKYDRFKMVSKSNLAGVLMQINTQDSITDDDIQGKMFSNLVGVDLNMKMYKNGKIKSISGAEALIERMINAAGDFDDFTKELLKESMKQEFGNESLVKSFEQMTFIYPTTDKNQGESWNNQFFGDLTTENTWTLDNVSENELTISGKSSVIFTTKDDEIDMNLTGDMISSIIAYRQNGFAKTMECTSEASGLSTMHKMNGIKLPTTVTTHITYKTTKHVQ